METKSYLAPNGRIDLPSTNVLEKLEVFPIPTRKYMQQKKVQDGEKTRRKLAIIWIPNPTKNMIFLPNLKRQNQFPPYICYVTF